MHDLQIFANPDFGNIRTLEENGKPLFCGIDVAKALGYSNTRDALSRHCRYVAKRDTPHPQSPDKTMQVCPEQIVHIKCFNETLWELIQAACNKNTIPTEEEERWDYFLAGCNALERFKTEY